MTYRTSLGAKIAANPNSFRKPMLYGPVSRESQFTLGELIQWSPLGPGGFPQMSLQGAKRSGMGELIEWTRLGPGGFPPGSLQGLRGLGATDSSIAISPMAMFAAVVGAFGMGYVAAKVMA